MSFAMILGVVLAFVMLLAIASNIYGVGTEAVAIPEAGVLSLGNASLLTEGADGADGTGGAVEAAGVGGADGADGADGVRSLEKIIIP